MAKHTTVKFYAQELIVEGMGTFPFDMLRYDRCFPATESASGDMLSFDEPGPLVGKRQVKLRRYANTATEPATEGRWQSFGWRVVSCKPVY